MDGVLAEDETAQIRSDSLDLFAFRGRMRALDRAAKLVAGFSDPLPDTSPTDSVLERPKLERELLGRLIEEETARGMDESALGDASGDLIHAIVDTWETPVNPQDWADRDAWVSKHLLEVRESLRDHRPRSGPTDLDVALYPLERLLAPLQFPRGSAAVAQVRVALDEMRSVPELATTQRIEHLAQIHLGVAVEPTKLRQTLDRSRAKLHDLATQAIATAGPGSGAIEARARELLFVEGSCPVAHASRVRSMGPPPERAAICGILRALCEEGTRAAALVALYDDVLLAMAAVDKAPPPRTDLLSKPDDDRVDALRRSARERPAVALGVALAAEILYGSDDGAAETRRVRWQNLGDAPLDIVERETR
jgi:hypothetical protein